MKHEKIRAIDLFCGAGGTSSGLALACKALGIPVELTAVNHWPTAVATHKANHPWAVHICESVERLDPLKVVPSRRLALLVASPECKHFSTARGGRPMKDQLRATAWHILKFAQELYVQNILIENVREFRDWGPLGADGRPLKSRRGETYRAFLSALRSLDYRVEDRILNAADFGDATSRERLFIIARRPTHKKIRWPDPSHTKDAAARDLFRNLKPWRAAREIIDFGIPGESIFSRKKPLAKTTLERIAAGIRKFCGQAAEPFLVVLRQHMDGRSLDRPLPAITAGAKHIALCQPEAFILQQQSGGAPRSVKDPVPSIATKGAQALVEPFIVRYNGSHKGRKDGGRRVHPVSEPLPTADCSNRYALCKPFIVPFFGERAGQKPRTHSVDEPLPAITGHGAGGVVEPFLVSAAHGGGKERRTHSIKDPLKTVTGAKEYALVQPLIVGAGGKLLVEPFIITPRRPGSPEGSLGGRPLPTVMCKDRMGVVQPFILGMEHSRKNGKNDHVAYIVPTHHGNGDRRTYSTDKPMPTITTIDAWGLVEPYLVKFYKNRKNQNQSVGEPLHTVTCKDRYGLTSPCMTRIGLDIRFRMLRPHELAAAMGFPKDYKFTGTREEQVKQVGNAVCVNLAKALCVALLGQS